MIIKDNFVSRHNGPSEAEQQKMLAVIGVKSMDELIEKTVPNAIRLPKPLDLPAGMTEGEYLNHIHALMAKNKIYKSYIGMGHYNTYTPAVILRNIFENPGWYTSYTPYQAEISQGRIEALLNYQTMISDLTGMPRSYASMLDDYQPGSPTVTPGVAALRGLLDREWTPAKLADALAEYYLRFGCGDISAYRAFRWNDQDGLVGIRHFESIRFTDLIGYMDQKKELQSNTLAFLAGRPANNVLLVGARGTGKSSSVKALANEYFNMGLRLVQIAKPQLTGLPRIMETLRRFASKHFILFLDDLSFEDTEPEYKYLKSTIEGGVESRPENVLIYATSNRRHLIKETWHDRESGPDDVYRADSMNETISLSDRFGLIINYRSPNQNEYLAIIDYHLRANGVILPPEELRILGQRWELEHSGRNGRTAKQFVTHYLGQMKDEKTKPK